MSKTMGIRLGSVALLAVAVAGCATGYNSVLFVTESNAGIDVDTQPPQLDLDISRTEGVLAPVFEDGGTPPVLASFNSTQNGLMRFLFGVSQTYATGEAANTMAALGGSENTDAPDYDGIGPILEPELPCSLDFVEPGGQVKPLFFSTATHLGLNVAWAASGASTPAPMLPSNVQIGFNRKEAAWAPVALTETTPPAAGGAPPTYMANMPSLLATIQNKSEIRSIEETAGGDPNYDVTYSQFFATGPAASELAANYGVRRALALQSGPVMRDAFQATPRFGTKVNKDLQELFDKAAKLSDADRTAVFDGAASLLSVEFQNFYGKARLNNDAPSSFVKAKNDILFPLNEEACNEMEMEIYCALKKEYDAKK